METHATKCVSVALHCGALPSPAFFYLSSFYLPSIPSALPSPWSASPLPSVPSALHPPCPALLPPPHVLVCLSGGKSLINYSLFNMGKWP